MNPNNFLLKPPSLLTQENWEIVAGSFIVLIFWNTALSKQQKFQLTKKHEEENTNGTYLCIIYIKHITPGRMDAFNCQVK